MTPEMHDETIGSETGAAASGPRRYGRDRLLVSLTILFLELVGIGRFGATV